MKRLLIVTLLFACTACNFQPTNRKPYWEMPCSWRTPESMEQSANVRWWQQFDEPILDNLILAALHNNQNLMVATATVAQFFYEYALQESALYPLIQGGFAAQKQQFSLDFITLPPGQSRVINQVSTAFSLSYMLDVWGRLRNLSDAAFLEYLSEKDARLTVILTLVSEVANAYFQLRVFDKQLEVSNRTVEIRRKALRIAEIRFKEGLVSEMEVKQAASEVDSGLVAVKQFEESIAIQENLISLLIGENPGPILRGKKLAEMALLAQVPTGLPIDLLKNRPDILQAEYELYSLNAQIGAARALFFPPILLTGFYGGESLQLRHLLSGTSRVWDITGSALQTIFDAGAIYSNLEITKAEKLEALHTYIFTVQTALKEVDDALVSHLKAQEIYEVRKDRVDVLQDYYNLALLQYNNGQTDYLTVLDAERNLFLTELDLAQSEGDRFTTLVNIYAALGGGWVVDADCLTH